MTDGGLLGQGRRCRRQGHGHHHPPPVHLCSVSAECVTFNLEKSPVVDDAEMSTHRLLLRRPPTPAAVTGMQVARVAPVCGRLSLGLQKLPPRKQTLRMGLWLWSYSWDWGQWESQHRGGELLVPGTWEPPAARRLPMWTGIRTGEGFALTPVISLPYSGLDREGGGQGCSSQEM